MSFMITGKNSRITPASATLGGADSQDVHRDFGHPGHGQTTAEVSHNGERHRERGGAGLEGRGSEW